MLRAQYRYGSNRPFTRRFDEAAFGTDLFPTVPEDRYDRQPWRTGNHLLVADVRLDNRDELVELLKLSSGEAAEAADSELFLHAWMRWGKAALERIVGDFAFAVFDRHARMLTLGRDPAGERPLFFACNGPRAVLAAMTAGQSAQAAATV